MADNSDLHNQDLVTVLDSTDRIAAGKPGQERAKNIQVSAFITQVANEISSTGFGNDQGSDISNTTYLELNQAKDSFFVLGTGDINGAYKKNRVKGNRVVLFPEMNSVLKHNEATQDTDSFPFWFVTKADLIVNTEFFAVEFVLVELSASAKITMGVTVDYVWFALETAIGNDVLNEGVFLEVSSIIAIETDGTSLITGFEDNELDLAYTTKGTGTYSENAQKNTLSGIGTISNFKNPTLDISFSSGYDFGICINTGRKFHVENMVGIVVEESSDFLEQVLGLVKVDTDKYVINNASGEAQIYV